MAVLSLSAHAALFAAPSLPTLTKRVLGVPERAAPARVGLGAPALAVARKASVAIERAALVERARADRARGALALGEFLLAANALDARDEGRTFDLARASALYQARLVALRAGLAKEGARDAVPSVFGDLHYYGRPGGRMGDALLDGGGACEPLSQLLASTLHDAGLAASAELRFYGGSSDGVTHLAPIFIDRDQAFDLLTGGPAQLAGSPFPAADLIEVYARAHGLAPPLPAREDSVASVPVGAAEPAAPLPEASSLSAGYPPNHDRFPGMIPLYQSRAVHAPDDAELAPSSAHDAADQALECAFFVRMAVLDPPHLRLGEWPEAPRGGSATTGGIELRRVPTQVQLDRTLSRIRLVEQTLGGLGPDAVGADARRSAADRADRLMGLACLSALYDRAVIDFTFAGEREMARVSAAKKGQADALGTALLGSVRWNDPEGSALLARLASQFSGRNWLLLVLPGGEVPVLRLVTGAAKEDWGRINALAALVVSPSTRKAAVDLLESRPRAEQVEVMHEVFHAHDHLRPWASNYALEGEGESPWSAREFARAYRVFRGMAWGLWEGARPMDALLAQLVTEVARAGLGREWERAFLEYYARNALNLRASRPDALPFSRALARFLRERGHADLEIYQTRLADLPE